MSIISTDLIEKYPYIVIEGPIGSGKTTLARKFAERWGGSLTLNSSPSQGTTATLLLPAAPEGLRS